MANIFDYIEWRGDLSFSQSPFNEIDNLILSRVSYFPFDSIIALDEIVTLNETYQRLKSLKLENVKMLQKEDVDLFPALANSERFGKLFLKKYINKRDLEQEKQFSAITILLPDGTIYVSYRGTDNTLIGWKEDFNMSFMEVVPAQKAAKDYLNIIAKETTGKLRVGGHSKGGNLAIYASAFCDKNVQDNIIEVYNNDGPGFLENVIETENYQNIKSRIHTYIPQTSIVGRILNNDGKCTVVHSTETGVYQHSLYSWQLLGTKFISLDSVTKESEFIDKTLSKWLQSIESEQREKFGVALFEILSATNFDTLSQIKENWFDSSKKIFSTYKNLDEESKKVLNETIKCLFNVFKENLKESEKGIKIKKVRENEG